MIAHRTEYQPLTYLLDNPSAPISQDHRSVTKQEIELHPNLHTYMRISPFIHAILSVNLIWPLYGHLLYCIIPIHSIQSTLNILCCLQLSILFLF